MIEHVTTVHRPTPLTKHGRGVAVIQPVSDDETTEEVRPFMRAVIAGLADLESEREIALAEAKIRLGLD